MHITIISASVRDGRKSHRVALHLERSLLSADHTVDLLDLGVFDFPLFHERLKFQKDPAPTTVDFAERVRKADGVIIVTPEYNGSFPASLKNVIDLLTEDWKGRPVSLCTASSGAFAGTQAMVELVFPLWKIKAWVVPSALQVPMVQEAFDEEGHPADVEGWNRRTKVFMDDLVWAIEAKRRMVD